MNVSFTTNFPRTVKHVPQLVSPFAPTSSHVMSAPEIVNVTPSMMYTPGLVIVYDPGPQVSSAKSSPLLLV